MKKKMFDKACEELGIKNNSFIDELKKKEESARKKLAREQKNQDEKEMDCRNNPN